MGIFFALLAAALLAAALTVLGLQATFVRGRATMADYTNPSNANYVAAGTVVMLQNVPAVAHVDILPSYTGALGVDGGTYAGLCLVNFNAGVKIYWDANNAGGLGVGFTTNATNTFLFGFSVTAGIAAGVAEIYHQPQG